MHHRKRKPLYPFLKICFLVVCVCCVTLAASFFSILNVVEKERDMLEAVYERGYPQKFKPQVSFFNLTEQEKDKVIGWLDDINPVYFQYARTLNVYKDISPLCPEETQDCGGFYERTFQDVSLEYSRSERVFKSSLCHELLHAITYNPETEHDNDGGIHEIVYDLGREQVCFLKKSTNALELDTEWIVEDLQNSVIFVKSHVPDLFPLEIHGFFGGYHD